MDKKPPKEDAEFDELEDDKDQEDNEKKYEDEESSLKPNEGVDEFPPRGQDDPHSSKPEGEHTLKDLADENIQEDSSSFRTNIPHPDSEPTRVPFSDYPEQGDHPNIPNLRRPSRENQPEYPQDTWPSNSNISRRSDYNSPFSDRSYSPHRGRGNKFHVIILILIGLAVVGVTVFLLKGGSIRRHLPAIFSQPTPTPTATPMPTVAPTPSPEPVDRSKFKLRVLNGTGKTGLAGTVTSKLKGLGYQIDKTGNATNSAFTRTSIQVKSANKNLLDQIIKDLTPDYDATGSPTLQDSDPNDGEVILGAK